MGDNKNLRNSASLDNLEAEKRREYKANTIINGILFARVGKMAKQKNNWPNESELKAATKKLAKAKGSAGLPPNANILDKTKYALCEEFVKYCLTHNISQRDVAALLEVNESRISEIVRYRIEKLTIDRLVRYLGKLNPKFKLSVAS